MSKNNNFWDTWADNVLKYGRKTNKNIEKGLRGGWKLVQHSMLQDASVHGLRLRLLSRGGTVLWLLNEGNAGAGVIKKGPAFWEVQKAALAPSYRGKGIYLTVLRAFRQWAHLRVASDVLLSRQAERFWQKIGPKDPVTGRYFINPGPSRFTKKDKQTLRTLLIAYSTEGIPKRWLPRRQA